MESILEKFLAYPNPPKYRQDEFSGPLTEVKLPKYREKTLIDIIEPSKQLAKNPYTIIYSHSNAENIQMLHTFLAETANILQCRVIAYDYFGYGLNGGRATEKSSYYIADQVFLYVRQQFPGDRLIVWGRSIGSGPTCFLAEKYHDQVYYAIIESGLSSACEVICKKACCGGNCMDQFQNVKRIGRVKGKPVKVLIIHGTQDETIPLRCSLRNFYACKDEAEKVQTSFNNKLRYQCIIGRQVQHASINEAGHNDIETTYFNSLFSILIAFLGPHFSGCKIENKSYAVSTPMEDSNTAKAIGRKNMFVD